MGPDRREHLPWRTLGGAAVPYAAGAGLRGLPHADPRPVPMLERDARRRRRDGDPRLQLRPRDHQGQAPSRAATLDHDLLTGPRAVGDDARVSTELTGHLLIS